MSFHCDDEKRGHFRPNAADVCRRVVKVTASGSRNKCCVKSHKQKIKTDQEQQNRAVSEVKLQRYH